MCVCTCREGKSSEKIEQIEACMLSRSFSVSHSSVSLSHTASSIVRPSITVQDDAVFIPAYTLFLRVPFYVIKFLYARRLKTRGTYLERKI